MAVMNVHNNTSPAIDAATIIHEMCESFLALITIFQSRHTELQHFEDAYALMRSGLGFLTTSVRMQFRRTEAEIREFQLPNAQTVEADQRYFGQIVEQMAHAIYKENSTSQDSGVQGALARLWIIHRLAFYVKHFIPMEDHSCSSYWALASLSRDWWISDGPRSIEGMMGLLFRVERHRHTFGIGTLKKRAFLATGATKGWKGRDSFHPKLVAQLTSWNQGGKTRRAHRG